MATAAREQPTSSPNREAIIIIGVLVPVVLIIVAVAVILVIIVVFFGLKRRHADSPEKTPESRLIAQEVNRDNGRGEKIVPNLTPALDLGRTQEVIAREERPPPYCLKSEPPGDDVVDSIKLNEINNKDPEVTAEPSSYSDNRLSRIETDDFNPFPDTNLNSTPHLVTIGEDGEGEPANV